MNKQSKLYHILLLINKNIKNHFSFFILIVSSIVYFGFNLWLKEVLTPDEYGEYALFNSYLTISMAFSLLGADQLLMRVALNGKRLVLSYHVLVLNYISLISFVVFGSFLYIQYVKSFVNPWLIVIFTLLAGLSLLTFSLFRVSKLFSAAQFQKNFWRLVVFLLCVVYYFSNTTLSITIIILSIIIGLVITLLISIVSIKKLKIKIDKKLKVDYGLWINYLFAMVIMNLMSNADRFLIDANVGRAELGQYFLLQNLFLFPLTQVQNYSGFRSLAFFKNDFKIEKLDKSLKKNFLFAVLLSLALVVCLSIFLKYGSSIFTLNLSRTDKIVILLLLLSGIIRIVYSVLSAAMGAVGSRVMIRKTNIWTVILSVIFFLLFYKLGLNIVNISILFILFWSIRSVVYYIFIRKYEI